MAKYYAVKVGRKPGIYLSWDECKMQVDRYSGQCINLLVVKMKLKCLSKKSRSLLNKD